MPLISFNSEQKMIQSEVRKFAISALEPISSDIDKNAVISVDIFKKLSELGLLYPIIPAKFDGAGLDGASLCIIIEELSKSLASLGAILVVNNSICAFFIDKYGTEAQKKKLFDMMNSGKIMGYVLENQLDRPPGKEMTVKPADNGASVLVNGARDFVLNARYAENFVLPVTVDGKKLSYIISKQENGLKLSCLDTLGLKAAGLMSAEFNGLLINKDWCLQLSAQSVMAAEQSAGFVQIGFSAVLLGIAQAALDASIKYSKERRQFGRAIADFYMIREMLADMKIKIEAARGLLYDAAHRYDHNENYVLAAALAFINAGETAVYSGLKAIQIHGGYGYIKDYPVERYLRDAKTVQNMIAVLFDMKEQVARELLG